MSKSALTASPSAVTLRLDVYYRSIVSLLDGIAVRNEVDQSIAGRFVMFAGKTFTPPEERPAVIESLARLRARVVKADLPGCVPIVADIDLAGEAIQAQPERPPAAANGEAEELPPGGFMAPQVARARALDGWRN